MKIIKVYYDTHMSLSHAGLKKIIGKDQLKDNECAVFINRAWTAMKMLTPSNTILYRRQPDNRPIDPAAIKYFPSCISGKDLANRQ